MILGLIGSGQWGQNYLRLLSHIPKLQVIVAGRNDWYNLIQSKKCDGVIIATPPESHILIAQEVLSSGKPVMIEKPLALSYEEGKILQSYEKDIPILVNHLHLFSPAFETICKKADINKITEINSSGANIGKFRNYSSLFDYGPHDLAMSLYLMKSVPLIKSVVVNSKMIELETGHSFNIELKYSKMSHNIFLSNVNPIKTRFFKVIAGSDIFVYDDTILEKLKINGEIQEIQNISTLENSLNHFLEAIDGNIDDRFGLSLSLEVCKILDICNIVA